MERGKKRLLVTSGNEELKKQALGSKSTISRTPHPVRKEERSLRQELTQPTCQWKRNVFSGLSALPTPEDQHRKHSGQSPSEWPRARRLKGQEGPHQSQGSPSCTHNPDCGPSRCTGTAWRGFVRVNTESLTRSGPGRPCGPGCCHCQDASLTHVGVERTRGLSVDESCVFHKGSD